MEDTMDRMINGWTGGAFLSENPEAYGMVSDAHPVAVGDLLLAVNGYTPEDGMHPPAFTVNAKGVAGLYEGLYHSLIATSDVNDSLLRLTFGESEGRQTHPLARYSAALTEVLAYEILTAEIDEAGNPLTPRGRADELSSRLPEAIDGLRDVIRAEIGPRPGSERFFAVSLGACRVTEAESGVYHLDIYTAGDFSLYLLDESGMCPLWTRSSEYLRADENSRVDWCRLTLNHPDPFTLLLLSRSGCEPLPSDKRGMVESPGLLWRHRIRMEEQYMRLLSSGAELSDIAEKAAHQLVGRCPGWDSVSGAFMICGGRFDAVKARCAGRLSAMEDLIALFPEGYDPDKAEDPIPEAVVECEFVTEAFKTRPILLEKTKEVLALHVSDLLRLGRDDASLTADEKQDSLTYGQVSAVFEIYDAENSEDRGRIAANCGFIRELLSEHWLTLRPLLCPKGSDDQASLYETCMRLQKQVTRLTAYRRKRLEAVKHELKRMLDVCDFQGEDWIRGRGGDDSIARWLGDISVGLPRLAEEAGEDWQYTAAYLRSLQAACTQERDKLFDLDTVPNEGAFAEAYEHILEGTLPAEQWRVYAARLPEQGGGMNELLKMAETLSRRNGVLYRTVENRAAQRRTVQSISNDERWQRACLLGALKEDDAWGKECHAMVDNGLRNEYRLAMRRRQEESELILRQREAFEAYLAMYETYEAD